MRTVAGHTFDEKLLPNGMAIIMDCGCRDFEFCDWFSQRMDFVFPIDADLIYGPHGYYRCAIAGHNGLVGLEKGSDEQATKIKHGDDVQCYTIEEFARIYGVDFFDLIKLDIEGSEYPAIMALTRPIAKQFSIEFHLHTKAYTQTEVDLMVEKLLSLGYEGRQHELTDRHCAGLNYWDSLFVLK